MIIASILILIVPVLLSVAMIAPRSDNVGLDHQGETLMFTLAERTVMASMQRRFGPQVSGIGGILQPFCILLLYVVLVANTDLFVCYADNEIEQHSTGVHWDIGLLYEWSKLNSTNVVDFFSGLVTKSFPTFLVFYMGYAIGFFDGEGSIVSVIRARDGNYRIELTIKVSQNISRVAALQAILKVLQVGNLYKGNVCEIKVQSMAGLKVWCEILLLGSIAKRRQLLILRYLLKNATTFLKDPNQFLTNCYLVNHLQGTNDLPADHKRVSADTVALDLLSSGTLTQQQIDLSKRQALALYNAIK